MGKSIPKSLRFVKDSLYDGEEKEWLGWYNNLTISDKRNVGRFLRKTYGWMSDEAEDLRKLREQWKKEARKAGRELDEEFLKGDYFIVGAIGSALKDQDYKDVDLLVVTNRIWRDMVSFEEDLLEQRLSNDFEYVVDPTVSEAYKRRPNRTLVTLNPKQGSGKSIHVTVQPEVRNERDWRENDEDPNVVLYRMGDTTGYHDTAEAFIEGMQTLGVIPTDEKKEKSK